MPAVDPTLMDTTDMSQYNVDRPSPSKEDLGQVDAIDSAVDRTKQISLDAAQSDFDDLIDLDDISSQKLSEGAFAEAQTAELDKRATVSYQLSELFAGIKTVSLFPLGHQHRHVRLWQSCSNGVRGFFYGRCSNYAVHHGVRHLCSVTRCTDVWCHPA